MCGIVGYIGEKQAYPVLINGLYRLEYRGYDSAGISISNDSLKLYKTQGKVADLENHIKGKDVSGTVGIAHTRWATHGEPNSINAHPHYSPSEKMAIIHNGIIENYLALKEELQNRGYEFTSETDSEVLIHLIEDIKNNEDVNIIEALQTALSQVVGAYAIVLISEEHPDMLLAARKGSPLVVGIGDGDHFIASDATPIVEHTKDVVYMNDEEIAVLKKGEDLEIRTISDQVKTPYIHKLEMSLSALEKQGFPHFMLKEIYEQPRSIRDSMRGRISVNKDVVSLGGIKDYEDKIMNAKRIILLACGTSWHAALVGEYMIETMARVSVEVEYASEFRYRKPIITEEDVVIAISQSGETADTIAAMHLAREKDATILGICNVIGSTIARDTDAGSFTHAGPEIGVASTKAFTAQVTSLVQMALMIAKKKGTITKSHFHQLVYQLDQIPSLIEKTLEADDIIKEISSKYMNSRNALYLGRGVNYPVALEGALKLKEISYIHAEGYPAAEMKHGPIALIDEEMPVVVIATKYGTYDKMISNIQEVKARKGKIIAIVTAGDTEVRKMADHIIEIPETHEMLVPLVATIPLQLLSYHIAVMRSCNVDQPRNLAKSVTVE